MRDNNNGAGRPHAGGLAWAAGSASVGGRKALGSDGVRGKRASERGLTLVELIVVLAIIALITAAAVPGIARLRGGADDSLSRASREIFQLLTAARQYATTYNVRTAVVYNLDNYKSPLVNPANDPVPSTSFVLDSVTGAPARFITAATLMYELPDSKERFAAPLGLLFSTGPQPAFVPANGKEWQWKPLQDGVAVLLTDNPRTNNQVYFSDRPRLDSGGTTCNNLARVGLYCGLPALLDFDGLLDAINNGATVPDQTTFFARFPAHVFTPDGQIQVSGGEKERYTFYMGYRPDEPLERRLTDSSVTTFEIPDPEDPVNNPPVLNLRVVPIELYRSTGRVKIAS